MAAEAEKSFAAGTPSDELRHRRKEASEMSKGASDGPIYVAIEARLQAAGAGGDLLDFGAGVGRLTAILHASGRFRSVTGADLYPRSGGLAADIRWVVGDLNDRLPAASESFDTIVAAEVIEHLENPRAVCRELFRLLRPGGTVVLSTPNNESLRAVAALLMRGHFVAFGETSYPAHITALTRLDLERVLTEAGFAAPEFSYTEVGGIPGMPARTWQSVLGPIARGVRFSHNVVVTARKPATRA